MSPIKRKTTSVTLAVGQTVTPEVNLKGEVVIGLHFDANLTGTALTFTVAEAPGGTFDGMNDNSGAITLTVAASKYRAFSQDEIAKFSGVKNFKMTSGTTQATNASVITIVTKQRD